jgi:hypothetical protein
MKLQQKLAQTIRKVDFDWILLLYIVIVFAFGTIFFILSFTEHHGIHNADIRINQDINGYLDAIYFSFVTSTSLGYGDIYPSGFSRFFAVIEVAISLFVFGILISKLFSLKQEQILTELYDVSFQDRVTRTITGLYNFRAEVNSIVNRLSKSRLNKKQKRALLRYVEANFHAFGSHLMNINRLVSQKQSPHLSSLSDFRIDIIFDNLYNCVDKIEQLLTALNNKKINWQSAPIVRNLESIIGLTDGICISKQDTEHTTQREKDITKTLKKLRKLAGIKKE